MEVWLSSSDLLVAGGQRVEVCVRSSTVLLLLQWLNSEPSDTQAAAAPSHSKHTHTFVFNEILKSAVIQRADV